MADSTATIAQPTPAQIKALHWFAERGKQCMFGRGDPTLVMVRSLYSIGWLETTGREAHRVIGLTYYQLSPEGRAAISRAGGKL